MKTLSHAETASPRWSDLVRLAILTVPMLVGAPAAAQKAAPLALTDTLGSFEFKDMRGDPSRPVRVWYYRPSTASRADRVVFLLHGSSRTGKQAQDLGAPFARKHNFSLIAPEFSQEHFPDTVYDFGGVAGMDGRVRADSMWTLSVIEHLFDAVKAAVPVRDSTYDIVGHSAGGQFTHRLVLLMPHARFRRAVVSSPGRYVFPVSTVPWPYGLGGSPADSSSVRRAFQRDVVVIVGDNDVADQVRDWGAPTTAQGKNRFARALRFYAAASEEAFARGVPLAWRLRVVNGVDHDPPKMVRAALQTLID